jgi:hypothetical protein
MKKIIRFGIFLVKSIKRPKVLFQFFEYNRLAPLDKKIKLIDYFPVFEEDTKETQFDTHYIYHPAWASRIVKKNNPKKHIDISSTLHFCSMLSSFVPTEFYDYRPANLILDNLKIGSKDLTNLSFESNSIESISCMHTVEHVGLGRYGDPIDPFGDVKSIKELQRVLAIGGSLMFVVPVGKQRTMFNAMRIYSYETIVSEFNELFLEEFMLIPDNALEQGVIYNPDLSVINNQNYGCGCFWFIKK